MEQRDGKVRASRGSAHLAPGAPELCCLKAKVGQKVCSSCVQGVFKGCSRGEQVWNKYGTRVNQGRTRWVQGGTKAEPRGKKKEEENKNREHFYNYLLKIQNTGLP